MSLESDTVPLRPRSRLKSGLRTLLRVLAAGFVTATCVFGGSGPGVPQPPDRTRERPRRGGGPQSGTGTSDVVRTINPPKTLG